MNPISILPTGIIQQHNTEDTANNRRRLAKKIAKLATQGARLIVLQELHDSLYFCQTEDVNAYQLATPIPGDITRFYSQTAKENGAVLVTSLFEERLPGLYHNTAVVFDSDGSIAGKYRKMHIPDDPSYYEKFYFTPGDLSFEPINTSIGRLGVMVCWDQWYPEAARIMALKGASMLIYPTAIGYEPQDTPEEQQRQRDAWITIQRSHAIANGLPVVSVNRTGFEASPDEKASGIRFWGSSFVAGPQGEILYQAPSDEETEAVVNIDLSRTKQVRQWWPFLRDRRIDEFEPLTRRCCKN